MSTTLNTTIPAGVFKTKCLQLMEEVHDKHIILVITKHGKPIARLVPIEDEEPVNFFGRMRGTATINGDITAPIGEKWDADE